MVAVKKLATDYPEPDGFSRRIGLHRLAGAGGADLAFLTKGGGLGAITCLEGLDAERLNCSHLDRISRRFEAALRLFDEPSRVCRYLFKRGHTGIPHRE